MVKLWHIIKHEYTRHVFSKRFLISLLSLPALIVAMMGVSFIISRIMIDTTPVGYVDNSGVLENASREAQEDEFFNPQIEFQAYQSEEQAQSDLENSLIQAYYVLPQSYPDQTNIQLVYLEEPASEIQGQFEDFVNHNLTMFDDLSPQVRDRLADGSVFTLVAMDGSRQMRQDQWYLIVVPIVAGIMFTVVILTSGGYLMQAIVEEKENRTMEIVITSVSPSQLMIGKIIGDIGIGLTQLVVWLVFVWMGLKVGGLFWPILQDISLRSSNIGMMVLILLPAFVMVAAFMAAIGATVTEMQEAQQVQGLIILPMMIPYYISTTIMNNPNGLLAVALSFFPITAPITLIMRMAFTVVPIWQIIIIIIILCCFAGIAMWFAGKAFRMGMLRYGKRLSLKEVFGRHEEA
jgi:ABC-2 type transport system permease protein